MTYRPYPDNQPKSKLVIGERVIAHVRRRVHELENCFRPTRGELREIASSFVCKQPRRVTAMNKRALITAERLREVLDYDPATGEFRWRGSPRYGRGNIGATPGFADARGRIIGVDGRQYLAHRLAFLQMEGRWPKYLDHVNRNVADNRWCNLREAIPIRGKGAPITAERLRKIVCYDPATGVFTWLASDSGRRANGVAGSTRGKLNVSGRYIIIDKRGYARSPASHSGLEMRRLDAALMAGYTLRPNSAPLLLYRGANNGSSAI